MLAQPAPVEKSKPPRAWPAGVIDPEDDSISTETSSRTLLALSVFLTMCDAMAAGPGCTLPEHEVNVRPNTARPSAGTAHSARPVYAVRFGAGLAISEGGQEGQGVRVYVLLTMGILHRLNTVTL